VQGGGEERSGRGNPVPSEKPGYTSVFGGALLEVRRGRGEEKEKGGKKKERKALFGPRLLSATPPT